MLGGNYHAVLGDLEKMRPANQLPDSRETILEKVAGLEGEILKSLSKWKPLRFLRLSNNKLTGSTLRELTNLSNLKRVRKIIPHHYEMHRSSEKVGTAEEFFEESHKKLLEEAQEWLKRTSESCSAVAVLIATVAFAAAYTVPGGSDEKTGTPILLHDPFFLIFTVMDVLSLASSLTSVVMFLSILTSPFHLKSFRHSLPRKLTLGFTFLFFSVAVTMLAFAATIMLIVRLKKRWTTTLMYTAAFLPVSVFALLQFPVYVALKSTWKFSLKVINRILPRHCRF